MALMSPEIFLIVPTRLLLLRENSSSPWPAFEAASPYAGAVAAVCDLLPGPSSADVAAARALAQTGPPTEQVGLDGYGFDAGPTSLLPTGARR